MNRHRMVIVLLAALWAMGLVAGCDAIGRPITPTPTEHVERIRLPMGYIPNVQFAPFYLAVENGYFREAGYEVDFDYSFETDGLRLVASGKTPFAVASGEQVLMARANGLPVVYIYAWWQKFPVAVIAREEANVHAPEDLKGQHIGLPGLFGATYIGLTALLHHAGLSEADVTLEPIGFNQVEVLATGQLPVVVGYVTNEPIQLRARGYNVTVLPVADYVALASNGLVTSEAMIREHPEQVRAFVHAFDRALREAIYNPNRAYEVSMRYVEGLLPDDAVQREVLRTAIEYWRGDPVGAIDREAWENMNQLLVDMGLIPVPQDLDQAVDTQFLPGE